MITHTLPKTTKPLAVPLKRIDAKDAPSISPGKVIQEIECDGEPPIEALRNSGMC